MKRINCSHYTDLDQSVIEKASSLGFPLIGGTALEVWANHLGVSGVRKRSDNDLDFLASSVSEIQPFKTWLRGNIDPDKVKVDMYIQDQPFDKYVKEVDGIKIISLPYILWSKITRQDRKDTDVRDIKWILNIESIPDEEIEEVFNDFGALPKDIYDLYKFVGCTDEVASEQSGYFPEN